MKAHGTYYSATLLAFSGVQGMIGTGKLAPESEAKAQQTFAVWGFGPGPYLFIPVLGVLAIFAFVVSDFSVEETAMRVMEQYAGANQIERFSPSTCPAYALMLPE